jgi:DNA modification methylase
MPPFRNRLNDLSTTEWLKFQKSWFVHAPPRRAKDVLQHPAKFPETLAQEFIEFFTKRGQTVLDPMVGTGSALVAALRSGRSSIGIELNPTYAALACQAVEKERLRLGEEVDSGSLTAGSLTAGPGSPTAGLTARVIQADASSIDLAELPEADYLISSPPYWDMLRARGFETQKKRRQSPGLDVTYSDDPRDLGNVADYDEFLDRLTAIYSRRKPCLRTGAYLTIIVKNIKNGGKIYPLAWDLASRLGRVYTLKDEKIWAQNDVRLAPYGLGSAWVSNTCHHYCLQFRNA